LKNLKKVLALLLITGLALMPFAHSVYAQSGTDYSAVPSTTKVDGKVVKLKSFKDGLKYYDIKVGTGPAAKPGQTVAVLYTGSLINGQVFDSTSLRNNVPFAFAVGVGQVIPGWDEGILGSKGVPGIKSGGQRRLIIPSALAYGPNPPPGAPIPPNATLVFDVKLVGVEAQ